MMTWIPDICVYHGGCFDGFAAALCIDLGYPDRDIDFVPASYDKPIKWNLPPLGKNILFVDMSRPAQFLHDLVNIDGASSVVVLDHHKTASKELEEYKVDLDSDMYTISELFDPSVPENAQHAATSRIAFVYNAGMSGASMAFFFTNPHLTKKPPLIAFVEDRDLWRFNLEGTNAVHCALKTLPLSFEAWLPYLYNCWPLVEEGRPMLKYEKATVEKLCENAYMSDIGGHTVPTLNVPYHFASDCGNHLLKLFPDAPFSATWYQSKDRIRYSLRSDLSRVSVADVAKSLGGGGHRNAAGYSVSIGVETAATEENLPHVEYG